MTEFSSSVPRIGGATRLAGVVGWPVAHSRSPRLHNHWLARYGIDGAYVPLPVAPADFERAIRGLQAAGFAGVNVTVPHKEAAFALCDRLDDSARGAGAVNTLVFTPDGAIDGSCTDGFGFVESLRAAGVDPAAGPVLLLGAGGAARAIVAALLSMGVRVTIANRTRARAEALAEALAPAGRRPQVADWAERDAALAEAALLVNATAIGLDGKTPLAMDYRRAPADLVVSDIVYVPLKTAFLAQAEAAGLRTVGGLGMLLHQARGGFRAWFGVDPQVDAALEALVAADIPAGPA